MSGGGYVILTEVLAVIGVPVMTKQSFVAAEKQTDNDGGCCLRIL